MSLAIMTLLQSYSHSIHASPRSFVLQVISVLVLCLFARWLYTRLTRHSISYLSGPRKTDWLFGNLIDIHFSEAGTFHLLWQKTYGHTFKVHGLFSELYLTTSDPKAIQHIYSNSNAFIRQTGINEVLKIFMGQGLPVVNGDVHKRQRRAIQPAFGISQLKALYPVFMRHVEKLSTVIKKDIDARIGRQSAMINVHDYAVRATLDIIGDAAFDYQFGALDNKQDELRSVLYGLDRSLGGGTKLEIFAQYALELLPAAFVSSLFHLPITKLSGLRASGRGLSRIAKEIVQNKNDMLKNGLQDGRDLMSILVRANANEKQPGRLSDLEVISEIASFTFAGHGTTANTLAFALWELAKDMDLQRQIRKETTETLRRVQENGETVIGFNEYEKMTLLVAFIKEVFRYHPIGPIGGRQAIEDSVVPLLHPVKLESGNVVHEIPISKGQQIWVNIPGYNRLPELFGEDAYEFNVNRWLHLASKQQVVGPFANLITFGHGPKACIGWKFSILEIQMLLIELVSNFEFSLPANVKGVYRTPGPLMVLIIEGERDSETALFLDVSIIRG